MTVPEIDESAGHLRCAAMQLRIDRVDVRASHPDGLHVDWSLEGDVVRWELANGPVESVAVDAVALVGRLEGVVEPLQVLCHGYQSWSRTGVSTFRVDQDPSRAEGVPDLVLGMYHADPAVAEPDELRSELVTALRDATGAVLVLGFLGGADHDGTIRVRPARDGSDAIEVWLEAHLGGALLPAGDQRPLHEVWIGEGEHDPSGLLETWAGRLGQAAGARVSAPYQVGWCSWYHYFHDITEAALRANLAEASAWPFDVFQLDDGYQRAIGDWRSTSDAWAEGLDAIVHEIRHAGLQAGIWTAPFLATADSEVLGAHPDWTSTHEPTGYPSKAAYNPGNWGGWALALDTTRPDVLDHLRETYAALTAQGFDYHKIDFCYAAALPARRHDVTKTRAESLRLGLDAVRDGIGEASFLLGCGCPFGPAVGVVDAMRVSADVAPVWAPDNHWPGLYETAPAAVNAIAASVLRAPMHRRLFINDPDCLLLRPSDTRLDASQRSFLAAVITGTGAFTLVSDDMRRYSDAEWGLLEALRSVHDDVDTLLDIDDPFADPIVVRSAAGTTLTVDWRDDAPEGPIAQLGLAE